MHIRAFLINTLLNKRGWKVDPKTIHEKVLSFVGRPLLLRRISPNKVEHEPWLKQSVEANFERQAKSAIGTIKRVLKDGDTDNYFADVEITNQEAADWLKAQKTDKLPIAVSPQIVYDSRYNEPSNIRDWFGTHLAIVSNGAYGPDAVATNLCEGPCDLNLPKEASQEEYPDEYDGNKHPETDSWSIPEALDAACASNNSYTSLHASDAQNPHYKMAMIEVVKPDGSDATNQVVPNQGATIQYNPNTSGSPIKQEQPFVKDVKPEEIQNLKPQTPTITKPELSKPTDKQDTGQDNKKQPEPDYKKLYEESQSTIAEHDKTLKKMQADKLERDMRDVIPFWLDDFLDPKTGEPDEKKIDAEVKRAISRNWTVEDLQDKWKPAVLASANESGCSCGGGGSKSASASLNETRLFLAPSPDNVVSAAANASTQEPWQARLVRYIGGRNH